ncbi:MAG: DUF6067 family protein [Armatimonadetes bacterium]|nr:DUF6067 family protein [Armatimonadota bacterium]MCX7777891.1 DUF6067 family protein [Armatimonadota bacterium]
MKLKGNMMSIIMMVILFLPQVAAPQSVTVRQEKRAPKIDGSLDEDVWKHASEFVIAQPLRGSRASAKAKALMFFTADSIYFGFLCEEPQMAQLRRNIKEKDGEVWRDDCVEIFIAPCQQAATDYYHILINSIGSVRDEFWREGECDIRWDSKVTLGTREGKESWCVELKLPLSSLDRLPMLRDVWRMNFARERYAIAPTELTTWSECISSFHEPERFGEVKLEGISNLSIVRKTTQMAVHTEIKRMLTHVREALSQLPKACKTEEGKKLRATLKDWERKLSDGTIESRWHYALEARRNLHRLKEQLNMVRLMEKLGAPYAVFAPSPMLKFRQDQMPQLEPCKTIVLHSARGEAESAQILITPLKDELSNVRINVSPLIGPGGKALFTEARLVGYVGVKKPTPYGFRLPGRYPDALLPLQPFDVKVGNVQSIWITVWVPQDATAGEYLGEVIIMPEGAPKQVVPIKLRVYDVTLPKQSFLRSCVLIWDGKAKQIYGNAWTSERRMRFYETCMRYRFTPPPPLPWDRVFVKRPDGTWEAKWDEFDREVTSWMDRGATAFSIWGILSWGTKLPPKEEQKDTGAKLRLLGAHLKERGWNDRFYFYVFDEPSEKAFDEIRELCKFVHEHAPNLLILLTAGYGATGSFRTHKPTPDGAAYRALVNSIGIWVPHIDCFDEPFLSGRKAKSEQVWMYVCISTLASTYPDIWRIDWTGVSHRAVGWWLWRYNCDGFLYWCVNYWTDDKGKPFNLFEDAVAYPGGNGDGFLFYPDPKLGDPLPSIRAELFRDGIEDYDLLCMLKGKLGQVVSDPRLLSKLQPLAVKARRLIDASEIIKAPNQFVDDPKVYEERHREMLETLEQFEATMKKACKTQRKMTP